MTLKLQMLATLDAKGVEQGAAEARREIGRLGNAVDQASAANDRAATSATNAAKAHQAAAQAARTQANAARTGGQSAAQATQLAAHEVTNLSYQMNDIAVGLASGQSPFTVMAQQGLQVSQIMGRRGLGQIIPAIGTGLLSLINPTTLFLAGITAVGYGASAVFSAMRDDIEDTDRAIERHTDLIARIKAAYDETGGAARRYGLDSREVLEADRRAELVRNRKLLDQQLDAFLPDSFVQFYPPAPRTGPNYETPTPAYAALLDDIRTFQQATRDGEADIVAFDNALAQLLNGDGLAQWERDIVTALRDSGAEAKSTAVRINELKKSLDDIGLDARREALNTFLSGQSDRTERLDHEALVYGFARDTGADRQQLEERLIRSKHALEARQEIERRRFRLDSKEADDVRAAAAARAEATIDLNRQKIAYDRLRQAREALTGQNDHIARLELETTLIGASNAERAKAIALLQAEQDIRSLKIDPGSAEAEQLRQAAARRAAAEARLEEARITQALVRGHEEDMQRLALEALLIGRSNAVRERAIALLEAEQDIRRRGIDVNGRLAETIRDNARALAQERSELERQKRAWGEVERAGTSAIDRITDGIAEGDIGGALESIGKDLTKTVLRLSTANPIKNALYGSDLPTLSDTGGIGGFFAALLGGGPQAMRAGTMNVQAATVMLNGSSFGSPFGAGFGSGAFPPAPGVASLLGGGSLATGASQATVASQAWDFFSGKGLKDFQVAAILGHIKAESGFNPLAVGDGGHSLGLFQHHRGRATGLLDFLGGRGNLGNVGGQLNYAWKELMTSEGRAFRNLLSSTNLHDATAAFGGFERPAGFSLSNPEAMHNWTGRLQFAEQALRDFGNRTSGVTGNLGRFGDGLGSAVTSLSQGSNSLAGTASDFAGQSKGLLGQLNSGLKNLFSRLENLGGGSFGAGGNWLASLFGGSQLGIALNGGIGLYNTGGFTGPGDPAQPAGIVHAQEFVFDAPAVRRLGVPFLESLRSGEAHGYRDGGVVSSSPLPFSAGGSSGAANPVAGGEITIRLIDADGNEVETRRSRTPDGLQLELLIDQANGRLFTKRGTHSRNALEAFDARNKVGSR